MEREMRTARDLTIRDLDEQEFQTMFEALGDSDPFGLCLNGEPIGLLDVRWSPEKMEILRALGIDLVAMP